jgi:hypothetical protein
MPACAGMTGRETSGVLVLKRTNRLSLRLGAFAGKSLLSLPWMQHSVIRLEIENVIRALGKAMHDRT